MKMIKNFALAVVSLISDLWLGLGVKPEVYDNRSSVKTKAGYILFVLMAALIAITTVVWVSSRIY
ncbi:hypothetical protein KSP24_11725 [Paenibacillus sp. AK121]|uniref:hypothetical protein n=1 Tax=Paenibacillus TaxID=44249 RepID=UPI001C220832|nr:hypothetical protein [Paenibacillus sp. AK121]MBU9707596.1 hypothetical protein [Paenibacillus sp. AK121]MEE4570065.1 hypothetical protein [Paenibacillus polymyxa]